LIDKDWRNVEPLGEITCSSFDCENDLHCFRRQRPKEQSYRNGICISCGTDPVDWARLDKNDIRDAEYTVRSLKYELFRNYYWNIPIDEVAIKKAYKNGLENLQVWAAKRIEKYVSLPSKDLFRDGIQTPLNGNVVYYAQHATGCCCRKCMEEWHGINRNTELTDKQIHYFSELITLYAKKRVPNLPQIIHK